MARDHANLRIDIWADEDYVDLLSTGQWLYYRLLTHETLSYCGVVDWRPGRIAASARDLTATDVEMFAAELEERDFLVIDRSTEEALVRSFVKHDGLMDKWNLAEAVARTFTGVASQQLRGVIVNELTRLQVKRPEYRGWSRPSVKKVLDRPSLTPSEARRLVLPNPTITPRNDPSESDDSPQGMTRESPNESPSEWGNARGSESPNESPCPTTSTPTSTHYPAESDSSSKELLGSARDARASA